MKYAAILCACIVVSTTSTISASAAQPNIVLLFVDDMGWTNLGYRDDQFDTPNIDQLAKESVDFTQAYAASPTCSPSRATLVTGKHPARLQIVRHVPTGPKHPAFDRLGRTNEEFNFWKTDPVLFPCRNWLPLEHTTYAEALKDSNYYNLFVGKWHLGHDEYHPIHQGFDRQFGTTNWGHPKSYQAPFFRNTDVLEEETEGYLTDRLTDETVDFIKTYNRDQPFMVSMWYYNVHTPHIGRKDLVARYAAKGLEGKALHYAAMVTSVDESVGRIRDALSAKGIDRNTVVIFTSDQGSWFESPPYRGSKRIDTLCEGGARVPMLVNWPGVTTAGRVNDSVVQTTDLFPTLVDIAGGDPAKYTDLDGVSLVPALRNNSAPDRNAPIFGYRAYEDLYASVREGPWKLLAYRSGKRSLYNIAEDRSEQNDRLASQPLVAKDLTDKLKEWERELEIDVYSGVSRPDVAGAEFVDLLASGDLSLWRVGRKGTGWTLTDGVVHLETPRSGSLITRKKYEDFELVFDWKISEGGNSGVIYRAQKGRGLEYQVLDDERHVRGKDPIWSAGSLYDLAPPVAGKPYNVAGRWNTSRIVASGNNISHWMNGRKLLETETAGEDWAKRYDNSKYPEFELTNFGNVPSAITFQDHGHEVWYRNIQIRELTPGELTLPAN